MNDTRILPYVTRLGDFLLGIQSESGNVHSISFLLDSTIFGRNKVTFLPGFTAAQAKSPRRLELSTPRPRAPLTSSPNSTRKRVLLTFVRHKSLQGDLCRRSTVPGCSDSRHGVHGARNSPTAQVRSCHAACLRVSELSELATGGSISRRLCRARPSRSPFTIPSRRR